MCAADAQNNCTSNYTNIALGATVTFPTDPTITSIVDDPTGVTVTTVKAAHISELRTAVNAVRSLAGWGAASWTNAAAAGDPIYKEDVRDLREKLDEALVVLAIQISNYTDSPLVGAPNGTLIKKTHITELRDRARSGSGTSGSGGSSGGVQYVLSDVQGSSRTVMNNNGAGTSTVVARHDYLPFGQELGSLTGLRSGTQGYGASDTNRQKYGLTERDDATGLDHTGWRKYESTAGRWTSPDPLAGSLADPQSFNRYAYTQNDPVNFTDSSGLNVDSSEGDGYCIRYHYTNRSTGASFWGTWTCFPGSGAGGAGGEAGVGGKGVRGKRQDFKNFLKTMSQECKDALKGLPGNVIGKLSKLANTAKVYNVDNLQNARASRYVDEMAQRRETLGQWFDRSAPPGGAYSVVRVPRTGIYTRGGEGTFAGQFYFMLHEMTHLAYYNTRVDTDLDRYLARGLGLTKGSDESWSATVSRFFNSKCTEKGP